MRYSLVLGSVGVGILAAACSSNGVDTSGFKEGYNERNGQAFECSYEDPSEIKRVELSVPRANESRKEVQPGLVETDRAAVIALAKTNAIASLRASAPTLRVIGSCALECVPVERRDNDTMYDDGVASPSAGGGGPERSNGGASQTSTTNNQVAGVDEADFLKNDNQYLYVATEHQVQIIDAWPAAEARTVATIPFEDSTPSKLFLGNDRLLVYSKVGVANSYARECTYGFDCVPTGDGSMTRISVFDISDRSAPRLTRTIDLSGSLIAARKIGDAVHTVVYDAPLAERLQQLTYAPPLDKNCYDVTDDADAVVADYRLKIDAQAALIEQLEDADGPSLRQGDTAIEPQFRASTMPGEAFLTVLSTGIEQTGVHAESVISRPGFVYASDSGLYVSVPHDTTESGGAWYAGMGTYARASEIYKFAIGSDPSSTRFEASGVVKGTVLNQFAMDEWGGHLRVATTSGRTPDPDVHSTLTVLASRGGALEQTGVVDDIAKTEDIRSVRFDGDRGFLVTFKKTDPLFAFDLANPSAPRLTGELKIPGFSTYMHFMDRTHLLAIGLEADEMGDFAFFNGIQLQIFDISNLQNPSLLHKTIIGTRGTTSEALTNHLGFNYFAPKDLLALPMTTCEGGGNGSYGGEMTFNGLLVYDVTTSAGFNKRGGIQHPVAAGVSCNNWWTQAGSTVKRSVIMDDFVYSVASDEIRVANVNALDAQVARVPLGN